jgi:hypothetical protein
VEDYLVLGPGSLAQPGRITVSQVEFAHGHADAAAVAFFRVEAHSGCRRQRPQEFVQGLDEPGIVGLMEDRAVLRRPFPAQEQPGKLCAADPALPAIGPGQKFQKFFSRGHTLYRFWFSVFGFRFSGKKT